MKATIIAIFTLLVVNIYGQIPNSNQALVWLDGTIEYYNGNYYFNDTSGNGRDFLITGYDFEESWVLGMPYKSAATISAPVGDATLIDADTNYYLYDNGGNPNQISVVSLFQNVDYSNKIFCRHIAQQLNSNGVETYEPRVVDFTVYSSVRSGIPLTDCNTYFSVPSKNGSAKWIDPLNGNDATGNGSEANPYKTHSKVNGLTLTEGTLV